MRKISKLTSLSLAALMAASVMPTAFAAGEAANEPMFSNNFEEYSTDRPDGLYVYTNHTESPIYFYRYYTGYADNSNQVLKSDATNILYDEYITGDKSIMAQSQTGDEEGSLRLNIDGHLFDTVDYAYKYMATRSDKTNPKFVRGGLPGYIGLSSLHTDLLHTGQGRADNEDACTYDLCVVDTTSTNKALKLDPHRNGLNRDGGEWSMFGKNGLSLGGKLTKISIDVNLAYRADIDSQGAFCLSITNRDVWTEDPAASRYDVVNFPQWINQKNVGVYDAVMFKSSGDKNIINNKIYLGPSFGTSDDMNEAAYVCDFDRDTNYTVEYYLDLRDLNAPKHTVRILKGKEVVGYKTADLPDMTNVTTTVNNMSFYKNLTKNNLSITGNATNPNGYFGSFDNESKYGVYAINLTKQNIGNYDRMGATAFIDNFSAVGVNTVPTVDTKISGTVSGKAVAAKVSSLNALDNAQLIAAEYDGTTGRFIQYAKADVTAAANTVNKAVTVTFTNDLTANSKIKLFLWDSLDNIASLADSVTVR